MAAEPASVELGDYLGVIRRRYVVVGAAVAICVLLGAAYGLTRPDVYRANAQIALPAATDTQTPAAVTAEVQTELAVIRSELVAARAAEAIPGSDDTRTLLGRVSVEAPPDARILIVSYAAAGPEAAQRGAQAFAEAYLAQKESEQSATIETRGETFRERIASVEEGIDAQVALRDDAEEGSAEAAQAQDEIDRASTTLSDLTGQLTELESTLVDGGTIITPARLPQGPQPRGLARTLAAALAAGLLLGLGAAFVLDRLDTRLRGAADLQRALGVSVLGSIPTFPERHRHPGTRLVTVHAPAGLEADAFRRLRTSVVLASRDQEVRTLAITSSVADEGKTTVAANLAVALAQGGRKVILVSADLRRAGIEELFDLPASPGLSDLLLGHRTIDEVEHRVGDLTIITRGSPVENATDLLGSESSTRALLELAQGFDLVIIDTPPVLAVADVLVLAPLLDATLMVVSLAQASTAQVAEAGTELTLAGAKVLGAAINNDADSRRRSASASAYGIRS
ncbi:polysaccharide biosynthesis tyrosine autokinase [Iamia sp.]|uniref:polysaccharide biosynthesis tyrosine autokinase n=1 Tax=Iamia sp. TaxID=2722710 RepID=UPI002CE8D1D2|nr:polysaccharide biosynthesis tyrosine autokinase [Iamia sp.]HXH58071.1 polysaccharide biosynthesis tyrosine autokinase [Iamia sp.]